MTFAYFSRCFELSQKLGNRPTPSLETPSLEMSLCSHIMFILLELRMTPSGIDNVHKAALTLK